MEYGVWLGRSCLALIFPAQRMAYQGEYFVERYGRGAAEATPPVAKILAGGVPVSAGTENQVTLSVHILRAASRSRQLRSGYIFKPPTVLPVTSQANDTQGFVGRHTRGIE